MTGLFRICIPIKFKVWYVCPYLSICCICVRLSYEESEKVLKLMISITATLVITALCLGHERWPEILHVQSVLNTKRGSEQIN